VSIEVAFESRCGDAERAEHFHRLTTAVAAPLAGVGQRLGVPPTEVTVVFADDFVATVDELLATNAARAGSPHQTFTTDRVGGTVAAKNIPMSADGAAHLTRPVCDRSGSAGVGSGGRVHGGQ
jgi:hypothetical protein